MSVKSKHLTLKERVVIYMTPCQRHECNHAICRAHRNWILWRTIQEELACMSAKEMNQILDDHFLKHSHN
jgi:hypothetical protein